MTWIVFTNEDNVQGGPDYEFETKEAAIDGGPKALDLMSGEKYHVAVKGPPTAVGPDAEEVIECAVGQAYEQDGDPAEEWLANIEPREVGALQLLLDEAWNKWLDAYPHLKPKWFMVADWETYTAP